MFLQVDETCEDKYVWLTATSRRGEKISIKIKRDDDGVVVDLYPFGEEDVDRDSSTWLEWPKED
jgi:hypothetical protein